MALPILRTKIIPPPIRETIVHRQRLIDLLEGGKQKKLSLIAAPAGFGKTTLARVWTNSLTDWSIAWVSLDYKDNDPKLFMAYLTSALHAVCPELQFNEVIDEGSGVQSYELNSLMTILINIISRSDRSIGLVIDDYHVIYAKEIHAALQFLIDHQPPQLHIIITSREQPDLPLHRLRARNQLTEIDSRHLRFQEDEIAQFLKKVMNTTVTSALIKLLARQTEGWIAGLQMAALALNNPSQLANLELRVQDFTGHHHYVLDYFGEEVLANLDEPIRQFLFQTSILSSFSAPLCQAVTNRTDSEEILDYIQRANLFLIPLDENREWYRYHHLFAEFLQGYLSDEAKTVLHKRASRWFSQNKMITEGIEHAIAGLDFKSAERLIVSSIEGGLKAGNLNQVRQWINSLPEERLTRNVYLLSQKGWVAHLSGDPEGAERYAILASGAITDKTDPGHIAVYHFFRATIENYRGNPEQSLNHVALGNTAITAAKDRSVRFFAATAYSIEAEAHILLNQPTEAFARHQEGYEHAVRDNNHLLVGEIAWNIGRELIACGERLEGERFSQDLVENYQGESTPLSSIAGFAHIPLARAYYEANEMDKAQEHANQGIKLLLQIDMHKYAISGYLILAELAFSNRDLDEADRHLRKGKLLAHNLQHASWIATIDLVEAAWSLRIGNLTAYEKWAKASLIPPHLALEADLLNAQYLVTKGDQAALPQLERLVQTATGIDRQTLLIDIQLLLFKFAQKDEALKAAIRIGAPGLYIKRFLSHQIDWRKAHSTVEGIDPFFAGLLQASNSASDSTIPAEATTESPLVKSELLSEREIEILGLVAKGLSNREIGQTLFLTTGTTKWYLNQIYQKLNVRNRAQAVDVARDSGWIR